jgi:signal transduction histidine kinase
VRFRLTLLYGALFLGSSVLLLALTYVLVARQFGGPSFWVSSALQTAGSHPVTTVTSGIPPADGQPQTITIAGLLGLLALQSGVALACMAVVSIGLGWLVAGRALRPLQTIATTTRDISASSLHRRLALDGPDDEIKEIGSTIDGLLERLERSFEAQRQFVANASHELRTPLSRERTLLELALADPSPTIESLQAACQAALVAGAQQERLIEALITLARSERGLDRWEPVDLAVLADEQLLGRRAELGRRGLRVGASLDTAPIAGDDRLIERLVANLVDNAARYNVAGGWIELATRTESGLSVLVVGNSGPVVPPAEIDRLFEPFQRRDASRLAQRDGLGLGLSIVRAIAAAHGAALSARPRPQGGLDVRVCFPALGA